MPPQDWHAELFIPLADFKEPPLPAEEWFRKALGRARSIFKTSKPHMASDQLQPATAETLDDIAPQPPYGPVLAELRQTLAEPTRITVIVLPAGDEIGIVRLWAEQDGHQILTAPPRSSLIEVPLSPLPDLAGSGRLVIPHLERWFLRHRNGLRQVRALLAALDASDRPVVIGCNTWAWAFLSKAVAADQLLPDPITVAAFDGIRLRRWFAHEPVQFRRASTGADVLDADDDGKPSDDLLRTIAGRSLGIPWVAWHLWRQSLYAGADSRTVWAAPPDEIALPSKHQQSALMVLHALLIHGRLDAPHLRLVLPIVGESNIVSVLIKTGFVGQHGDEFAVRPAAYPVIRAALELAGLPLDRY